MGVVVTLGEPQRHFWLTRSVARALGVHLGRALDEGRLTTQDYSDLVTRCRRCTQVEACQIWLAIHGAGADAPPEHCALGATFNALKN